MRVLVTRPRRDAERTASALRARGHEAVIAPVLEIVGTSAQIEPLDYAGVIATSAHAFEFLAPSRQPVLLGKPVYVVGERTKAAAQRAGFGPPVMAATAIALLPQIVAAPGAALLYLAGRDRKPDLEDGLRERGVGVHVVEVYEARARAELEPIATSAIAAGRVDAVLHFSRRSAEIFCDLATKAGLEPAALRHVCISPDAAAALPFRAAVAPTPDSQGLFQALEAV